MLPWFVDDAASFRDFCDFLVAVMAVVVWVIVVVLVLTLVLVLLLVLAQLVLVLMLLRWLQGTCTDGGIGSCNGIDSSDRGNGSRSGRCNGSSSSSRNRGSTGSSSSSRH